MKLNEISGEKFNELAFAEPNTSIYQSTYYANYMAKHDYKSIFVEATDDNDVCTSLAMILLKKKSILSRKNNAYCPFGYLTNYYDSEDFQEFHNNLLKYLKKHYHVSSLIIEPFIETRASEEDNHLKYFIENIGYSKIEDLCIYRTNLKKYKKLDVNKNLFFIFNSTDDKNFIKTFINSDQQDLLDQYNAFEKHGIVYQLALDSFRTKTSIKNNIKENISFIETHKGDYKYLKASQQKKEENEHLNAMLGMINKYENAYGVNPILGASFIVNYADNHQHVFTINKDGNNMFYIVEALMNNIVNTLKKEGVDTLFSLKQIMNSDKVDLLGKFFIEL